MDEHQSTSPNPTGPQPAHHIPIPPIPDVQLPKVRLMPKNAAEAAKGRALFNPPLPHEPPQPAAVIPPATPPPPKVPVPPQKIGLGEEAMIMAADAHMAAYDLKPPPPPPAPAPSPAPVPTTPTPPKPIFASAPVPPPMPIVMPKTVKPVPPLQDKAPEPAPSDTSWSNMVRPPSALNPKPPSTSYISSLAPLPPTTRPFTTPISLPRRFHWKSFFITLSLVALIAAGSYAAYVYVLAPNVAFPKAFTATDGVSQLESRFLFSVESLDLYLSQTIASLTVDVDRTNVASPRISERVDIVAPSLTAAGDIRTLDNAIYVRLSRGPDEYASKLKPILGRWYTLDSVSVSALAPLYGDLIPKLTNIAHASLASTYATLVSSKALTSIWFAGFGMVNGRIARLYKASFDRQMLANMVSSILPVPVSNIGGVDTVTISTDILTGQVRDIQGYANLNDEYRSRVRFDFVFDDAVDNVAIPVPQDTAAFDAKTLSILQNLAK